MQEREGRRQEGGEMGERRQRKRGGRSIIREYIYVKCKGRENMERQQN